jgi:hypothetical protein
MKKLNYFVSVIAIFFLSCSADSNSSDTPEVYSIVGIWKTTSSVLNGVERFGGSNPIKSELNYINANGTLSTQSYSDTNYTNVAAYSSGTYSLPNASTINSSVNSYSSAGALLGSYNTSGQIQLLNATQLQIKILNYPAVNDVYIQKFVR